MPKPKTSTVKAPEVEAGSQLYSTFTDAVTSQAVTVRNADVTAIGQHADGSAYLYTAGQRLLLAETAAVARETLGFPALEGAGE